jgi:hypothetical protein
VLLSLGAMSCKKCKDCSQDAYINGQYFVSQKVGEKCGSDLKNFDGKKTTETDSFGNTTEIRNTCK